MKCQILFSGKNKKNIINLSSAENAQRVVKVNHHTTCESSSIIRIPVSPSSPTNTNPTLDLVPDP